MPKKKKIRMIKTGKPATHLNQRCSSPVSLLGAIRTFLQLRLRWLIRNHILLWKSFLTRNMSNSTSTSLASELSDKISTKLPSANKFSK
ncbi:death-associated protein [Columba livia]|uniref:Death-associated protein n=1 Tax=Columba livia TaxID=8932 RepID=A0A2I0MW89_COLLI|nr:death-associated protein [Columba livia]